jgi:hypothetical protein
MKNHSVAFWAINSFVAGLVLSLFFWVIFSSVPSLLLVIDKWQNVLIAIVTVLAGIGSVAAIYSQILQTNELAEDDRIRKNLASRAELSQPLSDIIGFQETRVMEFIHILDESNGNETIQRESISEVDRLDSLLPPIVRCIENSQRSVSEDMSKLVSLIQIQNARLTSEMQPTRQHSSILSRNNLEVYVVDAIEIHARASRLLNYARLDDQSYRSKDLTAQMSTSTFLMNIDHSTYPRIHSLMQNRTDTEVSW